MHIVGPQCSCLGAGKLQSMSQTGPPCVYKLSYFGTQSYPFIRVFLVAAFAREWPKLVKYLEEIHMAHRTLNIYYIAFKKVCRLCSVLIILMISLTSCIKSG